MCLAVLLIVLAAMATAGTAFAGIPGGPTTKHGCITFDSTIWNSEAPWGPADGQRLADAAKVNSCSGPPP